MNVPHVIKEIGGYGVRCSCGSYFGLAEAEKLTQHLKTAKPFPEPKPRALDPVMVARWVAQGHCPKCGCSQPPDRNSGFWDGDDTGTIAGCTVHGAGCGLVFDFKKRVWREDPVFFERQAERRRRERARGY